MGSFWNSHYNGSCIGLGHGPLIEMLDSIQCKGFPTHLVTNLYCHINAKYIVLSFWKSISSRMIQHESVLNGEQQVPQLFILKITRSLQPTSSKTRLILKETNKNKTPTGNKFKSQVMSSDPVSITGWANDLQQVLSCTASFSHL